METPAISDAIEVLTAWYRDRRRAAPSHGPGRVASVVVVDLQYRFVDQADEEAAACLRHTAALLKAARQNGVPTFLVRMVLDGPHDVGPALAARNDMTSLFRGSPAAEIHGMLDPAAEDRIIDKKHASSFFETSLDAQLKALGVDTIFLAGATTSGCIRATAIEGSARGYRMELVEECLYDQRPLSGPVALWEIQDRYGDVIHFDAALDHLVSMRS